MNGIGRKTDERGPVGPVGRKPAESSEPIEHLSQNQPIGHGDRAEQTKKERSLIMKTRRLCAVIAAAATLLGGMAFGTAGAYAAGDASIEVRHSREGHTYSAYKFASLTPDGDAVQVDTDADWVQTVTAAVDAANAALSADAMPGEYDGNPAAFAATKTEDADAAWFRSFADALAIGTGVTADGTVTGNGDSAAISPLEEGWYLITDVDKDGGRGINAIVATTLDGVAKTFTVKGDPATGQGKIDAVGAFVAKNEDEPEQPDKTADQTTTADGVGIGQTVTYTIALDIPAAAEGYDTYPYFVKDVASKGLTVNKDFSAKIGDADVTFTYVTAPTVGSDGKTTTVLEFDLAGKSGRLVITYTAVVNKDIIAAGGKVSNTASVSRDGEAWIPPVEFESYTGGFDFHKYGVGNDANGLAGATFNVFEGSVVSKTPLRFVKTGEGVYRLAEASKDADAGASADVVTTTGNVRITGLKSGEYTLKETGFVAGYAKNFVPTFTVKLTVSQKDGASTVKLVGGNNLGLASMDETDKTQVIQVKNVKNITQLPLTGAAGTALFTIVALVMAGAGLLIAFRSRDVDSGTTAGV